MGVMDSVKTINSLVRTIIGLVILAVVTVASWYGYVLVNGNVELAQVQQQLQNVSQELQAKTQQVDRLQTDLQASQQRIDKLETALHLLKIDHRLAEIVVLEQGQDADTERKYSVVEFVEVTDDGKKIDEPKRFRLDGDKVYVDYWVVKFDDKYVEASDLHRSTSICLFRGIHGEYQSPSEAYRLDTIGTRPAAYSRGRPMSDFEKQIWTDFWDIANDLARARKNGIRAAHGEEAYTQLRQGKTYRLELRASGGLTIKPATESAVRRSKPSA